MSHPSQEAIKVAEKFVQGKAAKSPLVNIGIDIYSYEKGRRVTTDGNEVLSYDWWRIAFREGDSIYVTTDQYQTGEWKSGKPKYSPTTNGHIRAVVDELYRAGYREVPGSFTSDAENHEFRTYQEYLKEN